MSKVSKKLEADLHPEFVRAVRQIQTDLFKTDRWGNSILRGKSDNLSILFRHLDHDQGYEKNSSGRVSRKYLRDTLFRHAPAELFDILCHRLLSRTSLQSRFSYIDETNGNKRQYIIDHPYWGMVYTQFEKSLAEVSIGRPIEVDTLTDEEKARCVMFKLNLQS